MTKSPPRSPPIPHQITKFSLLPVYSPSMRMQVIHDAAVLANHYRSLRAEIQKERAERQAARAEVQHLTEDVQHLRSWLVTVFWTWGLVVAVVGALLAGMMNQLTRSLWTAFLV